MNQPYRVKLDCVEWNERYAEFRVLDNNGTFMGTLNLPGDNAMTFVRSWLGDISWNGKMPQSLGFVCPVCGYCEFQKDMA